MFVFKVYVSNKMLNTLACIFLVMFSAIYDGLSFEGNWLSSSLDYYISCKPVETVVLKSESTAKIKQVVISISASRLALCSWSKMNILETYFLDLLPSGPLTNMLNLPRTELKVNPRDIPIHEVLFCYIHAQTLNGKRLSIISKKENPLSVKSNE
ncbi:hypothetical protein BD560DRAFT_488762, partial [Blakeslea trispora]